MAAFSLALSLAAVCGTLAPGGKLPFLYIGAGFAVLAAVLWPGRRPLRMTALLCAALACFAGYSAWRAELPETTPVRSAEVCGIVADAPEWQPDRGRAVLRLTQVTLNGQPLGFDLRAYIYGTQAKKITIADELSVKANVYSPSRGANGGFDFQKYLWSRGVGQYISVQASDVAVLQRSGGPIEAIATFRRTLQDRFDALFPKHSALLRALLLGDRTTIDEAEEQAFSDAGIMHLLAVSGLHVSVVAAFVTWIGLLLCIPRRFLFPVTGALLAAYALLCGGSPSVVRAAIMYALYLGGQLLMRPEDGLTRTSVACALMLLVNPLYLWQASFLLSFCAAFGLAMLLPTLNQLWKRARPVQPGRAMWIADALVGGLATGAAVQLATLPVLLETFGEISWLSLLLNLLCVPLASAALVLGMLAVCFGGIFPPLAWLTDAITGLLSALAHWASGMSVGMLTIPGLSLIAVLLYAACFLLGSAQLSISLKRRALAILMLPLLVAADGCGAALLSQNAGLVISYLDVGQGDGALVSAEGKSYLIDVGDDDGAVADYVAKNRLSIEAVFLSHAHDDHAGGLAALLEVCTPTEIYLPDGYDGPEADDGALAVIEQARAAGVDVMTLAAGDSIALSEHVTAQVLAPVIQEEPDGGNDVSMVLWISCGEGSALFTGDLPIANEPDALLVCSVLKVAHHGSASSTSSRFLAMARPALAVISVGAGNPYGHPTPETLERLSNAGCEVLRTDLHGMVTVWIRPNGDVWARTELPR